MFVFILLPDIFTHSKLQCSVNPPSYGVNLYLKSTSKIFKIVTAKSRDVFCLSLLLGFLGVSLIPEVDTLIVSTFAYIFEVFGTFA